MKSKPKRKTILGADLFCGAGGTSQGMVLAANALHADLELLAINHWQIAIDTHTVNHPEARNLCTGVDVVDPLKIVPGGRLDILCASPECTHHSVARGGRPMNDQSRASAWHIARWAQVLFISDRPMTPEEKALHEIALDKRQAEAGAYESVRFANIRLQEAKEAAHLARHNFHSLRRANDRRCGMLDDSRECFEMWEAVDA